MDQLPKDVLVHIFSFLAVKTILRFRGVCKLWLKIINSTGTHESDLPKMHLNRGMEKPGILFLANSGLCRKPTILSRRDGRFLDDTSTICRISSRSEASHYDVNSACHGILCVTQSKEFRMIPYLVNPYRQEVVELPAPESFFPDGMEWCPAYGLGYDSSTMRYKVVAISEKGAMVYTLGTNSSWRALRESPRTNLISSSAIYAGGVLYWALDPEYLPEDSYEYFEYHQLVAFHVGKEEFRFIPCPGNFWNFHMVDLGGVLGVVNIPYDRDRIEIWTLKDYEGETNWVMKHTSCDFRTKPALGPLRVYYLAEVIGLWEDGELLLSLYDGELFSYDKAGLFSYDPNTESLRKVHIRGDNYTACSHTGSLVSLSWFKES